MTKRALLSLVVLLVAACFCLSMVLILFALATVFGSNTGPASFHGQPLYASLRILAGCISGCPNAA
jgi:hypothetical protein